MIDYSFIGAGSVHIQPYDKSAPLLPMGNISEFAFSFEEEKKEQKNYMGGGGLRNVVSRISGITGAIKAHDFTPPNIALALRASLESIGATPVVGEQLTAHGESYELIPFRHIPDITQTVTVKDSADQDLALGTDYALTKAGIRVLSGTTISAETLTVDYTPKAANAIQALLESGKEFTLFMEGLNDAQEGRPFTIRVHRVKFSPVQNLGFISEDFAEIALAMDILADPLVTGSGLSPFMQLDVAD
ncbi:phage tail tube protein [Sansalvadorimonas verongulae]|uniref:phage tail tube protein n=1 Tax=Sansalvadorimonas verongulae TaxID=2172824 RepID=UPI0012BCE28D|nr:hypothetical protein [Sansalvadorimonas verongulae]MTI15146.1 hypothetical protein [Sansalvadorimonas verongulae]